MQKLKAILDFELKIKSTKENLFSNPDPLQIASKFNNPHKALICALFSYGNAGQIVKFLSKLDFEILNLKEEEIKKEILNKNLLYRFQNPTDIAEIFITFKRLMDYDLEEIIFEDFQKTGQIIDGINALIKKIYSLNDFSSQGFNFYFGKSFLKAPKSPYKRYNMWLRWMVRSSDIDLGLFTKIPKSALILPLDTHTHKVSLALGLCQRKTYDFKAALEITQNLRKFDEFDPIKYDFALYRLGQSGEIKNIIPNL